MSRLCAYSTSETNPKTAKGTANPNPSYLCAGALTRQLGTSKSDQALSLHSLQALRQRLEAAGQLARADVEAVWRHACHHAAETVLEGIARAGAAARCTTMGRSAMSLDLQVLQRGIAQVRTLQRLRRVG